MGDEFRRQQLAQHASPIGRRALAPDAESLQAIVPVLEHCVGRFAGQDIAEVAKEEPPRRAQHRRHRFLRVELPVEQAHAALADVAMAARLGLLAKQSEQNLTPAARRFAQRNQIVEFLLFDSLARVGRIAFGDLAAAQRDVAGAIEGERVGGQAVAPGAPDLLIIGLDRGRHVGVEDEAHVRLVDAHAEGDRRADDDAVVLQKLVLVSRPHLMIEAGVIGQRAPPLARKFLGQFLGALAARRNR